TIHPGECVCEPDQEHPCFAFENISVIINPYVGTSDLGQHFNPLDIIGKRSDDGFQSTWRLVGHCGNLTATADVHKVFAVHPSQVDPGSPAVHNRVNRIQYAGWDVQRFGKIVHSPHWYDAEFRTVLKIMHAVDHFIDRTVAACGNDEVKVHLTGVSGSRNRISFSGGRVCTRNISFHFQPFQHCCQ